MNEEILKRLDLLGAKLNVAGGAMWDAAQRQVIVDKLDLPFSLVFIVCFAALARWAYGRSSKSGRCEGEGWAVLMALGGIAVIISACVAWCSITPWLNPQYDALCNLLALVKRVQP